MHRIRRLYLCDFSRRGYCIVWKTILTASLTLTLLYSIDHDVIIIQQSHGAHVFLVKEFGISRGCKLLDTLGICGPTPRNDAVISQPCVSYVTFAGVKRGDRLPPACTVCVLRHRTSVIQVADDRKERNRQHISFLREMHRTMGDSPPVIPSQ
jgi:hypothetical protein